MSANTILPAPETTRSCGSGAMPCSESSVILQFPPLEKCNDCAGSGLTWNVQRRTKRQQVASSCPTCHGTGRVRNLEPVIVDSQNAEAIRSADKPTPTK